MPSAQHTKKKILVVPLSWGLGHATRLLPVIREFREAEAEIIISGGPDQQKILVSEFPDLKVVNLPYLKIRLSTSKSQVPSLFLQLPGILLYLAREYLALKKLLRTESPDAVISDNCYALRNRKVPGIFITHQLNIQVPRSLKRFEGWVNRINHRLIRKFDHCWVPDLPGEDNLAGKLSHTRLKNIHPEYIGILSRFSGMAIPDRKQSSPAHKKILVLISGPENQRSLFENLIRSELRALPDKYSYRVIRGLPTQDLPCEEGWYNHVSTEDLQRLILEADTILCRAGYSTIMDLTTLGRSALLIPTPGQSEQEYLASYLADKKLFLKSSQDTLKLADFLNCSPDNLPGIIPHYSLSAVLLKQAVRDFLDTLE
ncbi:MAG: hypothetical protein JW801_08345 [Bacteroidales bacterium]|nr:hypothetical protein [Bacteroidales bacterium]